MRISLHAWKHGFVLYWNDPQGPNMFLYSVYTVWCRYNTINFLRYTCINKRRTIARPSGWGMGRLLWIQHLIDILPQFLWLLMQYLAYLTALQRHSMVHMHHSIWVWLVLKSLNPKFYISGLFWKSGMYEMSSDFWSGNMPGLSQFMLSSLAEYSVVLITWAIFFFQILATDIP